MPAQPEYVGVTVIVAVMSLVPLLAAVNADTVLVPLAARPILVLEFVHAKVVPEVGLVGVVADTDTPLQ